MKMKSNSNWMTAPLRWPLAVLAVWAALQPSSLSARGKPGGGNEPPPDPAIVYLQDGNLMIANEDGSNQILVLEQGRNESFGSPSWSPDGTTLVFGVMNGLAGSGIYTINIDGTALTRIADLNWGHGHPVWSPVPAADGQYKIAFSDYTLNPNGSISGNSDIFLVNPDGSGLQNLTDSPDFDEANPSWDPTATRLAVWVVEDAFGLLLDVAVLEVELGISGLEIVGALNLTSEFDVPGSPLNGAYVNDPAWSKTDPFKIIVGVKYAPEINFGSDLADLWIIDPTDPANPINLTQTPEVHERVPSWSADDSRIVYMGRNNNLLVRSTDGTGSATVLVSEKGNTRFTSPDWRR